VLRVWPSLGCIGSVGVRLGRGVVRGGPTLAGMSQSKVVYKITYPNGKVYVGMDLTGTLTYFGSPNNAQIALDFTPEQRRDFTIRKQILWESSEASDAEVRAEEVRQIWANRSNDPKVGYNRWPRCRPT